MERLSSLVLCQIGNEERKARVDAALLEEGLELGLDTLVKVVELLEAAQRSAEEVERSESRRTAGPM